MIADVGLIGKPNAGKSTLLSRVSPCPARDRRLSVHDQTPESGHGQVDMDRSFVMADIPGLIEGAHQGVGLGHEFLRHVERTRVLVHLVEPCPMDGSDPVENYLTIRRELQQYEPPLDNRPEIIAVTKAELPGAEDVRQQLAKAAKAPTQLVSSVTGAGLNELLRSITQVLDQARENE